MQPFLFLDREHICTPNLKENAWALKFLIRVGHISHYFSIQGQGYIHPKYFKCTELYADT